MHFSSWKCYKSNCYISYHNWTILSHFVHAIYYTCNLLHAIIFIYSMPFVDSFAANTASVCVKVSRCVCEVFECVFYVWCGLWCPGAGCSGQWGWLQMCVWGVWVCVLCMVWSLVSRCRPLRSVRMTTDCLIHARPLSLRAHLSSTHSWWRSSNSSTRFWSMSSTHWTQEKCMLYLQSTWLSDTCFQKCLACSQQFTHMGNVAETARCVFIYYIKKQKNIIR